MEEFLEKEVLCYKGTWDPLVPRLAGRLGKGENSILRISISLRIL